MLMTPVCGKNCSPYADDPSVRKELLVSTSYSLQAEAMSTASIGQYSGKFVFQIAMTICLLFVSELAILIQCLSVITEPLSVATQNYVSHA